MFILGNLFYLETTYKITTDIYSVTESFIIRM